MKRAHGFTLAEVLITITVIGIIAAVTIPTILNTFHERSASYRQANIVYKVTQAVNMMKANGELTQFNTTDDFVDALEKYLKIAKRCDSEHIAECWPTQYVTTQDGEKIGISTIKTGKELGFKTRETNNVSVVLADGASLIITYNPKTKGLTTTDKLTTSAKTLPGGVGLRQIVEYTTSATYGLAFVMDVNGSKGPNSETRNNQYHDIRSFNGATLSGCAGIKINDKCFVEISSYVPIDCSKNNGVLNHTEYASYCTSQSEYSDDYWAGAVKACEDIDMKLPTRTDLMDICSTNYDKLNLSKVSYWALPKENATSADSVDFADTQWRCYPSRSHSRRKTGNKVLCTE